MTPLSWLLTMVFTLPAAAETLYAPQACAPEEMRLTVANREKEDTPFWVLIQDGRKTHEVAFIAPARSEIRLPAGDLLGQGQSLALKHHARRFSVRLSCRGEFQMSALTSPSVEFSLAPAAQEFLLLAQNLHPREKQQVRLKYYDTNQNFLGESRLPLSGPFTTESHRLTPPPRAAFLRLEGEARLSAQLLEGKSLWPAVARVREPAVVPAPEGKSYFLLSSDDETDSFVIALEDAALIREAREIIKTRSRKITIARIAAVQKGFSENRDFHSQGHSPWSWRVERVEAFAEIAPVGCTGSPSFVEEWFNAWLGRPEPTICFWSYHLKKELRADEVRQGG
ncbi:MAG: hypothetical protein KF802_00575 [Bdellovibrionaceae bacterium]|nr:hypothetical protein [Pseudobdellovibrionaceae bacterium]